MVSYPIRNILLPKSVGLINFSIHFSAPTSLPQRSCPWHQGQMELSCYTSCSPHPISILRTLSVIIYDLCKYLLTIRVPSRCEAPCSRSISPLLIALPKLLAGAQEHSINIWRINERMLCWCIQTWSKTLKQRLWCITFGKDFNSNTLNRVILNKVDQNEYVHFLWAYLSHRASTLFYTSETTKDTKWGNL